MGLVGTMNLHIIEPLKIMISLQFDDYAIVRIISNQLNLENSIMNLWKLYIDKGKCIDFEIHVYTLIMKFFMIIYHHRLYVLSQICILQIYIYDIDNCIYWIYV